MAGAGGPGSPYGFPFPVASGGSSFPPFAGFDARTAEAVRYGWEANRLMALAGHSSPIFPETPYGRLPSDFGRSTMHPAYNLSLWEQMYRLQQANSLRGLSIDSRAPLSPDYLQRAAAFSGTVNDVLASSTPNLGLPFNADVSGLATPHPNPLSRLGRKRALSISPIRQEYDINAFMSRMSPNSLISGNSRCSSSASGHAMYAALASGMNPSMAASMEAARLQQFYMQMHHNPAATQALLSSAFHPPGMSKTFQGLNKSTPVNETCHESSAQRDYHKREMNGIEVVSSSVTELRRKDRVKKETSRPSIGDGEEDDDEEGHFKDSNRNDMEEDTFVETHCRWIGCDQEFSTQSDLVAHVNQEHVPSNRKAYVCRWLDCCREEKPFKAQYMLNVHMRRHTGEKPHICKFPGCVKAYSRLENLKTHERSHTGERPYVCEFPGCTKAFSNASDRAKHQNRTHSNAKPYICKVPGCTKRYTDPSSLRKHIKTVHGPEYFGNKKHKGNDVPRRNRDEENGGQRRSEESQSGISGTGSSEPGTPRGNVKQEKMEMSPSYSLPPSVFSNYPLDSPTSADFYLRDSATITVNSRTNDPIEEESEMDIPEPEELPTALHNAIYGPETYGVQTASRVMRQPLHGPMCPTKPQVLMAPPQQVFADRYGSSDTMTHPVGPVNMSELSQRFNEMRTIMEPREQYFVPTQDRRGSNASVSTYYCSIPSDSRTMSANPSRRVSTASMVNYNESQQSPPYDPISVGSSRRSSEPGLALSMTGYQQKMQMRQAGRWQQTPVPQPQQPQPLSLSVPQYHGMRRASEPVGLMSQQHQTGQRVQPLTRRNLQRHNSLCVGGQQSAAAHDSFAEEIQNDQMTLDEQENVLIPDDMVRYLNQVAEKARLQRESNPEDFSDDDTDLPVIHPNYPVDETFSRAENNGHQFTQSSAQHPYFAQQPQRRSSYAYGSHPVNNQNNMPQVSVPQQVNNHQGNFMTMQQGRQRRGSLQVNEAAGFAERPLTEGSPDSYEVTSTTHSARTPTQRRFSVNYTFQQEQHTASFVNHPVTGSNGHLQNTNLDVHSGMPSLVLDEHRYLEMLRS